MFDGTHFVLLLAPDLTANCRMGCAVTSQTEAVNVSGGVFGGGESGCSAVDFVLARTLTRRGLGMSGGNDEVTCSSSSVARRQAPDQRSLRMASIPRSLCRNPINLLCLQQVTRRCLQQESRYTRICEADCDWPRSSDSPRHESWGCFPVAGVPDCPSQRKSNGTRPAKL